MIGYREEDGKLESTEAYLTYVSAYVKLYAVIIQVFPPLKRKQADLFWVFLILG
jgi:GLE1-like protein